MSLHLLIGQSKAGKTSRLYQMLIERSCGQPDARLLLLVPRQYSLQAQKKLLSLHPRSAVMNVDILSFERLAYRVFEETGTSMRQILDETGKSMIIRSLLLKHKEELHAFRGSIGRRGFVEQMKAMISELLQYDITPKALAEAAARTGNNPRLYGKLRDIQLIYQAFMDFIRKKYITAEELLSILCEVLPQSAGIRESVVFMDNFAGFTPLQYRLIEQLVTLCPQVYMTLCSDGVTEEGKTPEPDDVFCLTKETASRLAGICRANRVPFDVQILNAPAAAAEADGAKEGKKENTIEEPAGLECLRRLLFREGLVLEEARLQEEAPEGISLFSAANPDQEMQLAARIIHRYVRDKGLRYRDMAVVTGDMEQYLAPARRWLGRYGIPCFFDSRRTVAGNMLIEWLRSFLETVRRDMEYESTFRFLHCGLGPLKPEETDELENYVLAYGIRGRSRWQKPFRAGRTELGQEAFARVEAARQRVAAAFEPLQELMGKEKTAKVSDLIRKLYSCMEKEELYLKVEEQTRWFEAEGQLERAKEYSQIWSVMVGILEKAYAILGEEEMSIREFSQVLESGISQIRLGIIPPGIDQVTFGDMKRSRLDDIRLLIFAGLNDGLVPRPAQPAGLISDTERELLKGCALQLAPTARENLPSERFYLYSCLTRPSLQLCLIYANAGMDGTQRMPSPVIRHLQELYPGMKVQSPGDGLALDVREGYEQVKEALSRKAPGLWARQGTGSRPDSDSARIADEERFSQVFGWLRSRSSMRGQMDRLAKAALFCYGGDSLSQAAIKAVYGGRLSGGVTMLEKYALCAYAHFLQYGLKLAVRQVYKVQAPDIGLIFHQSIERFSRRVADEGIRWRDIPDDVRDAWVSEAVRDVAGGYRSQLMQDTGRARYLARKIESMAKRTVWALQQQLKKGDFEPAESEFDFTTAISMGGSTLLTDSRDTVFLHGIIDRVDICEEDGNVYLRVLDYKTGKMKFDLSSVYHGLQLQLLVYMHAAEESVKTKAQKEGRQVMAVPAGVLYYDIADPLIETDTFEEFARKADAGRDGEDYSEDELQLLEKLAMNGLIVRDDDILRHMDRHPDERPKILPLRITKNKALDARSSVAEPEQFFLLSRHVEKKCEQLTQQIFSGDIAASPAVLGDKNACMYCRFGEVCGFHEGIRGYAPRKLSKMSNDEVYQAIAQE